MHLSAILSRVLGQRPTNRRVPVKSVTSATTLNNKETGSLIDNVGATGSVTVTLPASPRKGDMFTFKRIASQDLVVEPGDNAFWTSAKQTDGKTLTAGTDGYVLQVVADDNGDWYVIVDDGYTLEV